MKAFILASLLVVAVSASLEEHGTKFLAFKAKHGKTYLNAAEEVKRFNIFSNNLKSIDEHNARYEQGLETYKQGVTKFADMTSAEFKAMLALQKSSKPQINGTLYEAPAGFKAPASVDWRSKSVVTGIKDQGQCGGCWAFSLTGSTEGAYAIKTGNLVSLSEQQLIDCTTSINYGCDGGYLEQTWPYIEKSGLQKESDYPFTGKDGKCKFSSSKVVTKVSGFGLASGDENGKLLNAVAEKGPVSVAIDASYIQFYESGVYSNNKCSPNSLNHGVLIVGYGAQSGKNYWIVKNSWGSDWGDRGYILFLRGSNMCGIGEDTTYPTI